VSDKKKYEPSLFIDIDSDEALDRFIQTDPTQVVKSIKRAKKKATSKNTKAGQDAKPLPPVKRPVKQRKKSKS